MYAVTCKYLVYNDFNVRSTMKAAAVESLVADAHSVFSALDVLSAAAASDLQLYLVSFI